MLGAEQPPRIAACLIAFDMRFWENSHDFRARFFQPKKGNWAAAELFPALPPPCPLTLTLLINIIAVIGVLILVIINILPADCFRD